MTDDMIIEEYCATPQKMYTRYRDLSVDGKMMAVTPTELAAVLTRLNDNTINRSGALRVIDELERRNRVFVRFVNQNFIMENTNE